MAIDIAIKPLPILRFWYSCRRARARHDRLSSIVTFLQKRGINFPLSGMLLPHEPRGLRRNLLKPRLGSKYRCRLSLKHRDESLFVPALKIASGLVHKLPPDLRTSLASDPQAFATWEDISSIARNEWICWIESAKKAETRTRRIEQAIENLSSGKRRPCCWPGCQHR